MYEQLLLLKELQAIDLEILELKKFQDEFPKKIAELEGELDKEKKASEEEAEKLDEQIKHRKKLEQTLEENQLKISKYQEHLYQVKTNKEYRALLDQIEETQKANSILEEEIINLMEDIESQSEKAKKHEEAFKKVDQTYKEKMAALQVLMDGSEKEMAEKNELMEAQKSKIDPSLYSRYMRIKQQRGGLGIVETRNGVCTGCNLNIPPQMYNELLRHKGIFACPNCFRLLIHDGEIPVSNNQELY